MQREFLQEKSLNRSQDNAEKSLNVDLSAKSRLIPYSTAAGMLGLNDLYIEERDACENYRMIFTVSPICTNAIYNAVTEPVYKEGSYSATTLVETIVRLNDTDIFPNGTIGSSGDVNQVYAIRDTEFSHEKIGNFKYHCGYDIFNNHLLRTQDFDHAKIGAGNTPINRKEFNTIFDFAIDYNGKTVQRDISDSKGPASDGLSRENIRMYQLDNISSMNTAFYDRLRSVDGWYGFYNTGYINIPNGKLKDNSEVSVNKILNNETSCGFIDLYPDRSLYSFIPKVNRYKKRLERNWDCTIVYPYKSDYDTFNKVMMNFTGSDADWANVSEDLKPYAVKVLHGDVKYNNVGDEVIEIHSLLRHTLIPGDEIRIFYAVQDDNADIGYTKIDRFSVPVRVINVGDVNGNNENRCFTIKFNDIATFAEVYETEDGKKILIKKRKQDSDTPSALLFFYKKIENGYDDKYYFRRFKKLKNHEYHFCDLTDKTEQEKEEIKNKAVPVIREPSVVNENSPDYIVLGDEYFEKVSRQLAYTQNKIAFAENIFGDRVAQVIFNDDVCISGLKDNLGRALSVVYFTAVKTNRGHELWYEHRNTTDDGVEYSHCFGEITSGLDLPDESGSTEFNVRKLYNVFTGDCQNQEEYLDGLKIALADAPKGSYNGTPMPLESGITLDDFDEFLGDVVEFAKADYRETTIEKVYHRFNTAQRECLKNEKYYDVNYDELVGDLYDVNKTNE